MKILQINKFYYEKGGSERYMFELSKLLQRNGQTVIPFAMRDPKNRPTPYQKYFVPPKNFSRPKLTWAKLKQAPGFIYSLKARRKLEQLIKKEKPDIAHLHNIAHQLTPSIIDVLKKYRIPIVQTLHDYKLICPNYRLFHHGRICEKCRPHKYYQPFFQKCVKNSRLASLLATLEAYFHYLRGTYQKVDLFLAPSQFMQNKVVQFGIKENKVRVQPYTVNVPKPDAQPRQDFGLYAGRLVEEKGIDILFKAIQKTEYPLKIAGDGPRRGKLQKQARARNLPVEFLGRQSKKELWWLMEHASFLVVPSVWYENSPLIVYEALSLGLPVIAADIGGLPALVKEGKTGLLFPAGDAAALAACLNTAKNSKQKLDDLARNGQIFASRKLAPAKHYQAIMRVYNHLTRKRSSC